MPNSRSVTAGTVLEEVNRLGGSASPRTLRSRLGVSARTLDRRLQELVAGGSLVRHGHGQYALGDIEGLPLPPIARELAGILRDEIDGHVTGFDVLARRSDGFLFEYPHLVYVEPYAIATAELVLAGRGFVVIPAAIAGKIRIPTPSRVVLLRSQADAARRFGVIGFVAPEEKAWVDLLRETRKGGAGFDFAMLGRLLRAMLEAGGDRQRLRRYATRLGYGGWLDAIEEGAAPPDEDAARLIVAYRRA